MLLTFTFYNFFHMGLKKTIVETKVKHYALFHADAECQVQCAASKLQIEPDAFCLPPGHTQVVSMILYAGEREVAMTAETMAIIARIALVHGDEIQRHKFCR